MIRLTDLAVRDANGNWRLPDGLHITGEDLVGPIVLSITGQLTRDLTISGCGFTDNVDETFVEVPPNTEIPVGTVILGADVCFQQCTFQGVAFVGTHKIIHQFIEGITWPDGGTAHQLGEDAP